MEQHDITFAYGDLLLRHRRFNIVAAKRLNPDYDPAMTYVPREERDEWVIVGLVGQVKMLGGQPVNDRWVKMRDVSDTVEQWFIR